jgi:hypothetical protein
MRKMGSPPDYKPVPVSDLSVRRQSFLWTGHCWPILATYPEVVAERATPAPLFGLAPRGVYPATAITRRAVRSYRTFSPLPATARAAGGVFSVALSVKPALSGSPRPLAGTLPCGDRTFLPRPKPRATAHPAGSRSNYPTGSIRCRSEDRSGDRQCIRGHEEVTFAKPRRALQKQTSAHGRSQTRKPGRPQIAFLGLRSLHRFCGASVAAVAAMSPPMAGRKTRAGSR